MMSDVMWDRRARIGGITLSGVAGESAIAVWLLMDADSAQDLHRYLALMETLLLDPLSEPAHGDNHNTQ
ncbi:hypothetical protein [Streptomyces sp. NPDC060022]|uniref:hypothetical protein n=1 Tax=Streptomyces sp. NPDC060022 TaxID=3347039 RepID=UPI0036D0BBD1